MTELDQAISAAIQSGGHPEKVNKAYLVFLRTLFFLPVKKELSNTDEPFAPLFFKEGNQYFMLAFDTIDRLSAWAGEQLSAMKYVELSGRDLMVGINPQVYLGINFGTEYYKEFSPDEIVHMKKIITKIDQLNQ